MNYENLAAFFHHLDLFLKLEGSKSIFLFSAALIKKGMIIVAPGSSTKGIPIPTIFKTSET